MSHAVVIKKAVKKYGNFTALNGVDLEIKPGEFFTLLGPSGCGKTTLLRMIAGFNSVDGGEICFDEKVINNLEAHKRDIGMVFQNYAIFPHLTVAENVAYGLKAKKCPKEQIPGKVEEALDLVQIKNLKDRKPNELSGGQQQRVALARILVYEPDVIMLDEPFSALDYYLKEQLQFQVREVLRGYTGDVLMVSHSRDEVYRFCEKSIILNRGQVAMKGETRAIFQKPENVTAARLTGCKNFSRIRRIGEYEVEALDWGLTFQTEEAVAAEHAYIGIRAHQFYPAHGSANEFTCEWRDTLCQPFEWDVLLRPVENAGAAGDKENALEREVIWWKVDYKQSDLLNQYQRGDRVRLGIAPGDIMLLKEG